MQSFAFDSERITKSSIQSTETHSRYTTRTVKHVLSRHCTILEDSTGTVCGTIDWRERTLELGGKKASIEQLKRKVSNFSMTRYWKWVDGDEYKVKYAENMWIVTASMGEVVAEFTSTVERALRSNLFPVWRIARDVRDEERQFLLLILLYSETKRLDRED
ncbi:hypothetical protein DFH08DRAFT_492973 [Mycena albidolilacea]|uniref:Uncharacterized protein n=1 Tax=Mycena albidolilacea TaxID=1033008 RepID=A0AAD7EAK8_9AGAR|nr:hypothetical protein DFH08DRAFT_492973 [Mycena albidolilacea]